MNTQDMARVRLPLEAALLERLAVDLAVLAPVAQSVIAPEQVRRQLLGRAVRLTDAMAPLAVRTAEAVREEFGLEAPVEIYQSAGRENAAMHLLREPILMEIQGRLLSLLDEGALRAVVGHEFGHYIAHGPDSPRAEVGARATALALSDEVAPELTAAASCLCMARELTADRFALLATRDLHALLRLEMVATTGLPAESLGRDTEGYLAQCRELVEACLADAETAMGVTHPEHGVRAWAAWLFSESDLFRELTGVGPGTRPIAEVESLIEQVIRRPDLDGSYHYLEVPPPELHEAALSAAVLVAAADGALGDDEAETIEKTFAALVPEWRRFLAPELAAQRLQELAPVAAAFGPGFQRPLFNLLLNVLAADGVAEAVEFQRIADVGRILGCEELFEYLMRGALRRLAVERRESVAARPLPVCAKDAAQALEAFLGVTVRRGGGQTTVRRLLRLVGAESREPDAMRRIAAAVNAAGLRTSVDWSTAGLEDNVTLLPVADAGPSEAMVRPPPGALERAIQRLRDELISGDGHSPSVRMREIRSGRAFDLAELSRVSIGQAERVLAVLATGRRAVVVEGEQVGASKEADAVMRQLVDLRREHLARLEETGARDLYLGTGFVCGAIDGYVVRAPLLLQPVELERAGEGGMALVPLPDEPPVANQAVLRAAYHKAGLPLGEETIVRLMELAGDPARGVPALVEHLRSAGFDLFEVASDLHRLDPMPEAVYEWKGRRLEVEACAVVGLFPQSNSELLEDYEQLLGELARPGADAGELLGCARELLPAPMRASLRGADTAAREAHLPVVPVVPSDPSQVEVVRMARDVPALVVDGPPGTGKSQVIVNLVADAIARGERVAVVSEKRAALDVVANRLAGAGLGALLGVVHDVFEDRKALYARIHSRLKTADDAASARASAAPAEHDLPATNLRQRIAHLRQAQPGEPVLGALAAYAAGFHGEVPEDMPPLGHLSTRAALRLVRLADVVRPWGALLASGSIWRPTTDKTARRSLAGTSREDRAAMQATLARVVTTSERLERVAAEQPISPAASLKSLAELRAARETVSLLGRIDALMARLLSAATGESVRALTALRLDWQTEAGAWQADPLPVRFEVNPAVEPALVVLLAKGDSWTRWLAPAWWRARGVVRECLPLAWPDALGRPLDPALARDLHRRVRLARLWTRLDEVVGREGLREHFAGDAREIARRLDGVAEAAERIAELRNLRPVLESVQAWSPDDVGAWQSRLAERLTAAEAQAAQESAASDAAAIFHRADAATPSETWRDLLARFTADAEQVAELDRVLEEAAGIDPCGPLALAVCADAGAAGRGSDRLAKAWATARVAGAHEPLPPRLRGAERDDADTRQLAEALDAAAVHRRQLAVARANEAPLLRLPSAEKHARRTPEQAAKEKLQREVAKQRALLPLRTFVRTHADAGLFDALPIWLLSPETLAMLFPRRPVFDLVVFDEASQCTVAGGFPALLRARRVVIAGDDRQMPPPSFFKAARDEEEQEIAQEKSGQADFLDAESLLTLARQRMPARSLGWHYRCREEELIAFSNHAMYGGALLTCPSQATPLAPPALRWVAVTGASYEEGRNEKEAERVVDLLLEALARKPAPTVGVVTFNLSQRRTVLDAIDRRREADPEFARVYAGAETREQLDDRPFVKNIENVQGDERDIIIFSIGHAPVERRHRTRGVERYVPARFGPVGQRGGERRLNVAVSRARAEALVVASFEPAMLSVARAKNDGPRLFKAYLEYAHHLSTGSRTLAGRVLDLVRSAAERVEGGEAEPLPGYVPLAGQLAAALMARSKKTVVRLGASRFRVDVAVEGEGGHSYRLAVLCDDGGFDDGAFRKTQRAALLRRRGWRVVHVDSVEWLEDREAVLRRIERTLLE